MLLSFSSVFSAVVLGASLISAFPSSGPTEPALEARHGKSCGYHNFLYSKKNVCVKRGGDTPGTPGKGQSCPKNYYWHKSYGFCVPKNPWDDQGNPSCKQGKWNNSKSCCSSTSDSCGSDEFYWKDRDCCLKKGGPKPKRNPPSGSKCPPNVWSWDYKQGCCVPHSPSPPEPKCDSGWKWKKDIKCCREDSTPTSSSTSQPSQTPPGDYGNNDYGHGDNHNNGHNDNKGKNSKGKNNKGKNSKAQNSKGKDNKSKNSKGKNSKGHKRDLSDTEETSKRHETLTLRTSKPVVLDYCPSGYEQCPVTGVSEETECVDTSSEMTSCGGCTSAGQGSDCTKIPNVDFATCHGGYCSVYSCKFGYKPSDDGGSCVPA